MNHEKVPIYKDGLSDIRPVDRRPVRMQQVGPGRP